MTFVIEENAPPRVRREVEKLHQLAVNEFGYHTDHVLFTRMEARMLSPQGASRERMNRRTIVQTIKLTHR